MLRETNKDQSAIAQAEKTLRARCKAAADVVQQKWVLYISVRRPGRGGCGETITERLRESWFVHLLFYAGDNLCFNFDPGSFFML